MVEIKDKQLGVIVDTPHPAEFWVDLTDDLLDLLQCEGENCKNPHYAVFTLLRALMTDYTQAERLSKVN